MYTEFYHLEEKPFNLTPSSRFLYLSENHKEALALLSYGIMERKGFILLTGEVGTGKTTIIQALLANLEQNVQYVHLTNPMMSSDDFIHYLASSVFKRKVHFRSKVDFLLEFEDYLRVCMQHQKNFLLIIDEAQSLSFRLLEEIRLLSNMESGDEKLINIFLVGQPELNEKLCEPRCRALLQRIACRFHIPPLNRDETGNYVNTRLKVAGARNGNRIFQKSAIRTLYEYSGGYPRIINILADNALLLGYSKGKTKISASLVKQSYDELQILRAPESAENEPPSTYRRAETMPGSKKGKANKWRLGLLLMILAFAAVAWGITQKGLNFFPRFEEDLEEDIGPPPPGPAASMNTRETVPNSVGQEGVGRQEEQEVVLIPQEEPVIALEKEEEGESLPAGLQTPIGEAQDTAKPLQEKAPELVRIRVRQGDTLVQLAADFYGRADSVILDLIQKYNPDVADLNRIRVGQELVFPPLDSQRPQQTYTVQVAAFYPFNRALELFQTLNGEGYEVFILPNYDSKGDKIFQVAVGSFENQQSAKAFAASLVRKGVSDYAEVVLLEMK
jgi:type II secretory pathway predicted ATPase ExeA/phage tail protein X